MIDRRYRVKTQIISTYVYLITLATSFVILVVCISQVTLQQWIIIDSPSYDMYIELYKNHGETLSCPCTIINIQQGEIIHIEPRFHQICTSDFVSDAYFSYLRQSNFLETINKSYIVDGFTGFDSVLKGQNHLQLVALWCQLGNSSYIDKRTAFYATQFTAKDVLTEDLFNQQVYALIHFFITSTTNTFVQSLVVTQKIIQENAIMNGYRLNCFLYLIPPDNIKYYTLTLKVGYNSYENQSECICIYSDTCTEPLSYQDVSDNMYIKVTTVPGLLIGCYIDEATLGSTLECYYNQSCLNAIHSQFRLPPSSNASALDPSSPSQFNTNSSISSFVAQMMVENWTNTSSHMAFYNKCKPSTCTYSYQGKHDLLTIITTIIGLLGGLTFILKLIVPPVVIFLYRCRQYVVQCRAPSDGNVF